MMHVTIGPDGKCSLSENLWGLGHAWLKLSIESILKSRSEQ